MRKYTNLLTRVDEIKDDYRYYFNLGIYEANNGNINDAMLAYNKVLELNPDFAMAYMFIGILEFQKENYQNAYEYYTKAISKDDKMIDAYFNRAQIVFATKTEDKIELKNAILDLERAVELDSKFIDAYYSMAIIYKNLEDYQSSIKALDKILAIDEQSINARALKKLLIKKYLN